MISIDTYTKSTFSAGGNCVQVRRLPDGTIGLRDSKDITKPPHVFTPSEWHAFILGAREGQFDLPEFI